MSNRMSLVEIERSMNRYMWEDVPVIEVVESKEDGARTMYLVNWADDSESSWLPADQLHPELIEDLEAGLESDGQSESAEKEHPPVSKVQLSKVIAIRFSSIVRHHPLNLVDVVGHLIHHRMVKQYQPLLYLTNFQT